MANSMTEMANELLEVFNGLRSGAILPKDAVEINNTAGKIIGAAKVQLTYNSMLHRKETPEIAFLSNTSGESK